MPSLIRRLRALSLLALLWGGQNLWAEEAASPAVGYLNEAYALNLHSVSLDEATVPAGSFLSAFSGAASKGKNYFFTQLDANQKPHGVFALASASDGSVLSTGYFENGRMRYVRVLKSESEIMFEKEFNGDLEPSFGQVVGAPLSKFSAQVDSEKAASYRKLLRGFVNEPEVEVAGLQVDPTHTESKGIALKELLMIKATKFRENLGIENEEGVAIENVPLAKPIIQEAAKPSTPIESPKMDKYFEQVSSEILSDSNLQNLASVNEGVEAPRNPEAIDAAEVISIDAGDFRTMGRTGE